MDLSVQDYLEELRSHSRETYEHCLRSKEIGQILGEKVGLSGSETELLSSSCEVHDIGKLEVPALILSSPEPLDDFGWGEIMEHPRAGARLVKPILGEEVAGLVLAHHEPGYPRREVRGVEERAELKNLLRLADQFDALRAGRAYKPPFESEQIRQILIGKGFEEGLVDFLLKNR